MTIGVPVTFDPVPLAAAGLLPVLLLLVLLLPLLPQPAAPAASATARHPIAILRDFIVAS